MSKGTSEGLWSSLLLRAALTAWAANAVHSPAQVLHISKDGDVTVSVSQCLTTLIVNVFFHEIHWDLIPLSPLNLRLNKPKSLTFLPQVRFSDTLIILVVLH